MSEQARGSSPRPDRADWSQFEATWGERLERWFRESIEEKGGPSGSEARVAAEIRSLVRATWERLGTGVADARAVGAASRRALGGWRCPMPCSPERRLAFRQHVDALVGRMAASRFEAFRKRLGGVEDGGPRGEGQVRRESPRRALVWTELDPVAFGMEISAEVYHEVMDDFEGGRVARVNDRYLREKARWKIADRLRRSGDRDVERARNQLRIPLRDRSPEEQQLYYRLEAALADLPAGRIAPAAEAVLGPDAPEWLREVAELVLAKKSRRHEREDRRSRAGTETASFEFHLALARELLPDLGSWQQETFAAWARYFLIQSPGEDDFRSLPKRTRNAINRSIVESFGIKLVAAPGQVIKGWIDTIFVFLYPAYRLEVGRRLDRRIRRDRDGEEP